MKLFKKLFVFLIVLALMLTVTACTIDESELGNLINGLTQSNSTVTTSSNLPVKPSTSAPNSYGVDSSEPYYPINPTESTNSSIYLVPPSPPVEILPTYSSGQKSSTSQTTVTPPTYQTNGLYSFESFYSYGLGYVFEENTNIEPFTVAQGIKITTSSGKTARDGSAKGYVFTVGLQLGKNGSFDNKSLILTTTGYQQVEIYATRSSSGVISGELFVIDSLGYLVDSVTVTEQVNCNTITIPSSGTYALVATMESSITVWGVSFIENA